MHSILRYSILRSIIVWKHVYSDVFAYLYMVSLTIAYRAAIVELLSMATTSVRGLITFMTCIWFPKRVCVDEYVSSMSTQIYVAVIAQHCESAQ
jgi:hypothetical protein